MLYINIITSNDNSSNKHILIYVHSECQQLFMKLLGNGNQGTSSSNDAVGDNTLIHGKYYKNSGYLQPKVYLHS